MSNPSRALVPYRPAAAAAVLHHHALAAHDRLRALRRERGQGTVEYVALAMLIAAVMAGVVLVAGQLKGGGIAEAVVKKVKAAIDHAGKTPAAPHK